MMTNKLKILIVEDYEEDVNLMKFHIANGGIVFEDKVVTTKKDLEDALDNFIPDVVLCDHTLPQLDSVRALKMIQKKKRNIPFILVTGSVSEEFAVQMIQAGAHDYIIKDRMTRLPSAILNAIQKCRVENEKIKYFEEIIENEALLAEAERLAKLGSFYVDLVNDNVKWSGELYRILGYNVDEVTPSFEKFLNRVHPDNVNFVRATIENGLKNLDSMLVDFKILLDDGRIKYIHSELVVKRNSENVPIKLIGFNQDITKEKQAEEENGKIINDIIQRNKDLEQFAYIVSHNLRGPVANIMGYSDILKNSSNSESEKAELLEGISSSILKLDDVIKDLNTILQVRSNLQEHKEKILFSELVANINQTIVELYKHEQIEINTYFVEINEISSIKSYFYSIFYNLITNSIKYRQPDVPIVINIKSRNYKDKFELIFDDNGMGIDLKKNRESLFGLYKRFHPQIEGKGMGLFMVKSQIESLGGKIEIQSKVNSGTKFIIEFLK